MNSKLYLKILFVALWIITIFMFSNQNSNQSLELSNGFTYNIITFFTGDRISEQKKQEIVEDLVFVVRKGAHFASYFILAIFVYILLKEFIPLNRKLILLTIMACFIYAITDEIHQGFVGGRTPRILDVLIDTCGASLSTTIMYIYSKYKIKNK